MMEPINKLEAKYLFCAKYFTENKTIEISYYDFAQLLENNNLINATTINLNNPKLNPEAKHLFHRATEVLLNDNYSNHSEKQELLNSLNYPYPISPNTFQYYNQHLKGIEDEKRLNQAEKDSKRSLDISWWSFVIAIGAFVISGTQLWVDYYDIHHGKDFEFEKATMHSDSLQVKLDSMQVLQNAQIIELLQNNKQKDTIIVNVQIPPKK